MSNKFINYCEKFRVFSNPSKESIFNFQFQPGGNDPGWILNVPNESLNEFWQKYYEYKIQDNRSSSLLERPLKEFNVLKIDLDFKHNVSNDDLSSGTKIQHKYKIEDITEFIKVYLNVCKKYIKIPNKCEISILEKNNAKLRANENLNSKYIKDGIHIMSPDIVTKNVVLHAIRNEFIENELAKQIFEKFDSMEPIDKCVDKCVICSNAWFPLGSGKPDDNDDYYKITHTFNIINNNNQLDLKKKKKSNLTVELIKKYSNFNKKENVTISSSVNLSELRKLQNINTNKPKEVTIADKILVEKQKNSADKVIPSIDYFNQLLDCLSQERVENYQAWFNVGFCMFNIHEGLFDLFDTWSQKCPEKYNQNAIQAMWYHTFFNNSEKYENLNLGQLKSYAKKDNPKKFEKLENINTTEFLDKIVVEFIKDIYKYRIGPAKFAQLINDYINNCCDWQVICADPTQHIWFKFEKNVWEEDKGANKIQIMVVQNLLKMFEKMYNTYEDEINTLDRQGNSSNSMNSLNNNSSTDITTKIIKKHILENKIKSTSQIIAFLQQTSNRNNLIKDLETLRYQPSFYNDLDQNPHVFICDNFVLDCKNKEIRNGLPTDMNSIHSGIKFPTDTNSREAQKILREIEDFIEKIFPDRDIQEYVLNLCAESLSGLVNREEFFIHTGSGSNGKSVFGDLLSKTLGNYFYAPPNEIFNTPKNDANAANPIIANVKGKRFVMVSEPKKDKTLQSDIIKQFSGCDPITGRHLHKEPMIFRPQCSWHMACNDIPEMDSTDEGIWRRVKVIPYKAKFVSPDDYKLKNKKKYPKHYPKDPTIKEKLDGWAPYFLFKLWQKYLDLCKNKFDVFEDNNIPDEVKRATKDYKKESNIYEQFFENKCEEKAGWRQNVNEVFSEFKRYNHENDYNKKVSKTSFLTQMQRFMGKPTSVGREKYFVDHTIIDAGEEY